MNLLQITDIEFRARSAPLCIGLGAATFGAGLASAGASLANGIGQAFGANSANYKMRQHQTSERVASQQWQDQQRRSQNEFVESIYNKYDSPQALVDQYLSAGLNPRLAAGEAGQINASSGSSGSAPVGGSVPLMNPWSSGFTSGFVDIANALKSIAEAKRAGADTTLIELNVKGQEIRNEILRVDAEIAKKFAAAKVENEINKIAQDIQLGKASEDKLRKEVELIGKKSKLTDQEIDAFWVNVKSQLDLNEAKTSEANSASGLNQAKTVTEGTVQDVNRSTVNLNNVVARLRKQDISLREFDEITTQLSVDAFKDSDLRKAFTNNLKFRVEASESISQAEKRKLLAEIQAIEQDNIEPGSGAMKTAVRFFNLADKVIGALSPLK